MTKEEQELVGLLKEEVERLREQNKQLVESFQQLLSRNMLMAEKLDIYYEVRRDVEYLRHYVHNREEVLSHFDARTDEELLLLIEGKLEMDDTPLPPELGLKEVAEMVNCTQSRVADIFKHKTIYGTVGTYLDYLRLIRALRLIRKHPNYNIEVVAKEAGFVSVRTLNRKIQDTIGMTPRQFREMTNIDKH